MPPRPLEQVEEERAVREARRPQREQRTHERRDHREPREHQERDRRRSRSHSRSRCPPAACVVTANLCVGLQWGLQWGPQWLLLMEESEALNERVTEVRGPVPAVRQLSNLWLSLSGPACPVPTSGPALPSPSRTAISIRAVPALHYIKVE